MSLCEDSLVQFDIRHQWDINDNNMPMVSLYKMYIKHDTFQLNYTFECSINKTLMACYLTSGGGN